MSIKIMIIVIRTCLKRQKYIKRKENLFAIYADLQPLTEKIDTCHNNPEKLSTTKISNHAACNYSSFTHCSFHSNKNKHSYYKVKACSKIFVKI